MNNKHLHNKMHYALYLLLLTGTLYAQSPVDADMAAAARRLDEALSGRGVTQAESPVQASSGGAEPGCVNNPYAAFPQNRYLAAVGHGATRTAAEARALAALTSIFGQSIQSDFSVATLYSEAVSRGVVTVSENNHVRDIVVTAASLDTLIGAQIGSVWDDGRGMVYALAHLNRERTISAYTEMIRMNQANIERLTAMSAAEKDSFDGYARYKLAALISGLNAQYANVVVQSGGPSAASLNLGNANALNLEAANIIRNISLAVSVEGDHNNRIRDAFARALSSEGLRTQGINSPYTLEVKVSLSEANFPNNPFIFCRYVVSAELIERATGAVLLPFNYSDRAGHSTLEGAENAAIAQAERSIAQRYPAAFKEYLAALLPK